MDGAYKDFSDINVTSPQRKESSCRAVSINAAAFSNFQNDPLDSCHREDSGSRNAASRLSEKSVLPVSITNSPRQQASDTSTQIYSLNRLILFESPFLIQKNAFKKINQYTCILNFLE